MNFHHESMNSLPTYDQVMEKVDREEPLTALEDFIWEYDPANPEDSDAFMGALADVVEEAALPVQVAAWEVLAFMRQHLGETADWPMAISFDDTDLAEEFCQKMQKLESLVNPIDH